jgi:hypothetical protein
LILATRKGNIFRRDNKKEEFWRKVLRRWKESGLSQAEFCRKENLKVNTFSSWKHVIANRDIQVDKQIPKSQIFEDSKPSTISKHSFVEFDLSNDYTEPGASENQHAKIAPARAQVVAEFIDASAGRALRIFQGADDIMIAALVKAFSSTTGSGF